MMNLKRNPIGTTVSADSSAIGAFIQSLLPWLTHVATNDRNDNNEDSTASNFGTIEQLLQQIEAGPAVLRERLRDMVQRFTPAPPQGNDAMDEDERHGGVDDD